LRIAEELDRLGSRLRKRGTANNHGDNQDTNDLHARTAFQRFEAWEEEKLEERLYERGVACKGSRRAARGHGREIAR
jgi:hypothetical protein